MKAARKTAHTQRTRAQRSELLGQYHDSALPQSAFCEAHGLAISSFTTALRRDREAPARSESRNAFIPVLVDSAGDACKATDWEFELTLGAGIVLRIRRG